MHVRWAVAKKPHIHMNINVKSLFTLSLPQLHGLETPASKANSVALRLDLSNTLHQMKGPRMSFSFGVNRGRGKWSRIGRGGVRGGV